MCICKCHCNCKYKFVTSEWQGCNITMCGPPDETKKKSRTVSCIAECANETGTTKGKSN